MTRVLMFNIYSHINPINNSWIPPKKNTPIVSGAVPAKKECQCVNFIIIYTNPTIKLKAAQINPTKVANLKPTLV